MPLTKEDATLVAVQMTGPRSVEINPWARVYANDTVVMIRMGAMACWLDQTSQIIWDKFDPNSDVDDLREVIRHAALAQGMKIHYYRPKAKNRGIGRRMRKKPNVAFIKNPK